jgi:hypothetical protein
MKNNKEIYVMFKGEKVVVGYVNTKNEFTFCENLDMSMVSKKTMERLKEMYVINQNKDE